MDTERRLIDLSNQIRWNYNQHRLLEKKVRKVVIALIITQIMVTLFTIVASWRIVTHTHNEHTLHLPAEPLGLHDA